MENKIGTYNIQRIMFFAINPDHEQTGKKWADDMDYCKTKELVEPCMSCIVKVTCLQKDKKFFDWRGDRKFHRFKATIYKPCPIILDHIEKLVHERRLPVHVTTGLLQPVTALIIWTKE
jgi:hypothetical protein